MNSFLFNLLLILLCSLPVVQFSTIAFADYARFTNVNQIFGVQIKYLQVSPSEARGGRKGGGVR
jgi:LMBR1 domain-containing protein 1